MRTPLVCNGVFWGGGRIPQGTREVSFSRASLLDSLPPPGGNTNAQHSQGCVWIAKDKVGRGQGARFSGSCYSPLRNLSILPEILHLRRDKLLSSGLLITNPRLGSKIVLSSPSLTLAVRLVSIAAAFKLFACSGPVINDAG